MFICKTLHPGSQSNKRIRVSSGISLALDQIVRLLSKDLPQSCLKHKIKDKDNTWNFLCYFYMTLQKVICASTRAQNLWSTIWQTPRSAQQAKITLMKRCFDKKLYGDGSKPWYLVNPKIAGKWMFIPLKMYL